MDQKEFCAFIQADPNTESVSSAHYWQLLEQYKKQGYVLRPNWIVLIFGSFWFLYRRMYLWFFVFFIVVEGAFQAYFMSKGYDYGMAQFYSSIISQVIGAFTAHMLFFRFVENKMEKQKHLGVHIRLMLPFFMLAKNILWLMLLQFPGIYFDVAPAIYGVYPFLVLTLMQVCLLYPYYLYQWATLAQNHPTTE